MIIAECRISYAKMSPTSALKTYFQFAECKISYAKMSPTSALKTCFQIAECRISYAKIHFFSFASKCFTEKMIFLVSQLFYSIRKTGDPRIT